MLTSEQYGFCGEITTANAAFELTDSIFKSINKKKMHV
jgi:hypothetical protein